MDIIKSIFYFLILVKCVQISGSEWSAEGRIGIRFYTEGPNAYIEEPLESGVKVFSNKHYKKSLPLVILIHGMDATIDCEFVIGSVKAMFFKGVNQAFNIFALNLPELLAKQSFHDKFLYTTAINSKIAGVSVGGFFNDIIRLGFTSPDKIYVIGYSMGAQVAGYMARLIKKAHGQIYYISGLDPAGIGFTPYTFAAWYTGLVHVTEADAKYVHFLHCNSVGWGTLYYNATANFIFNGGYFQPGCATSKNLGCSHNRVPFYFIEGILFPDQFLAQKCSTWYNFESCNCLSEETRHVTFPPDLRAIGSYHLKTGAHAPYGQGETGIKCEEDNEITKENNEIKIRPKNAHIRRKYVKKIPKHVHNPQTSLPVFPHRDRNDYERLHYKMSVNPHNNLNINLKPITKSQKGETESELSLEEFLEKIHHNTVNK